MARILVLEPSADVRELLERVLVRLGHEAVVSDRAPDDVDVDAVVVEPTFRPGLEVAKAARQQRPDLPVICVSVEGPSPAHSLSPCAHIQKPFRLSQFEDALNAALPAAT